MAIDEQSGCLPYATLHASSWNGSWHAVSAFGSSVLGSEASCGLPTWTCTPGTRSFEPTATYSLHRALSPVSHYLLAWATFAVLIAKVDA